MSQREDLLAGLIPEQTTIHCIGIGGVGVSAIAEMLVARGFMVSGSDLEENAQITKLSQLGVKIFIGQCAKNVAAANIVIYSSAIGQENPEWAAAKEQGLPLYRRAQMLSTLTMHHRLIAVCGTHGKTSTTGLLVWLLHQAGMSPSFAVGGHLRNLDAYCQLTCGDYAVIEADESDASFLYYTPDMAILTNVDNDHLENYAGDYERLKQTYVRFLKQVSAAGFIAVCHDDEQAMSLAKYAKAQMITYGQADAADYRLYDFVQQETASSFTITRPYREPLSCRLNCPGLHNALNAAAVVAMADRLKIPDQYVMQALRSFSGMGRRFQRHGDIQLGAGRALLVEDYGHHPRELEVTLRAAREVWPDRRLVFVFQPHRFSRVQTLWDDFVRVLSVVDSLLLLDIYPAGEKPIVDISSEKMAEAIEQLAPDLKVQVMHDPAQLVSKLESELLDQDICFIAGAGSIGRLALDLKKSHGVRQNT